MVIWNRRWVRMAFAALCVAAVGLTALAIGAAIGHSYGTYRFMYAAPRGEALRGALAKLTRIEKTYAEFGQDLWVKRSVAPGKRDGYYVDVGSADGEVISNTKLLDELGWKGVCIDPFPRNMAKRTCQVFRQPVYSESGKRVQFRAAGDLGGVESDLNRHRDAVAKAPMVELVTATLDEILAKARAPKHIDYINLDVEGAEYDVLRGFSLDRYQVGCFTIEHNYEMAKREAIHGFLSSKGYVRVRSWEVDDWYVHKSLAPHYTNFVSFCSSFRSCPY